MHGPLRLAVALLLAVVTATAAVPVAHTQGASDPAPHAPGTPSVGGAGGATAIGDALSTASATRSTVASPVVQEPNTTSRLVLPDDRLRTVRFGTVRLDVGGSVAVDNAQLHGRYALNRLEQTFANAGGNRTAKRAVVNRTAARLDARIADLVQRERAALRAYNAGRLSTRAYLRELAAIGTSAKALEKTLSLLYRKDGQADWPVSSTRIARMKAQLVPLSGPVRDAVAQAMTGGDDGPIRVYVETSESGFVLSMVDRRGFATRYVREAYHGDAFDRNWADNPITHDEFENSVAELYPWVWGTNSQLNTVLTDEPYYYRAGIYGIAVNHPHGTDTNRDLVVYYDAGTQSVFHEVQRLDPASIPTHPLANATDEGLRAELHTTYPSGPMTVVVTDASTGEPVDASVSVDGEPVGSTSDGRLLTVVPRGNFAVTASEGGRNVTVSVTNSSINVARA